MFSFASRAKPGKHFLVETDDEDGQLENGSVQAGADYKNDKNEELALRYLARAKRREREEERVAKKCKK